jgi:uncharacterized protein
MDIVYQLQGVEFEWNENKAESNAQKHGVTFEEAAEVFFDPLYSIGDASVAEEYREYIIGYNFASNLLMVVYIERGDRMRIVSARIATRAERRLYEQG